MKIYEDAGNLSKLPKSWLQTVTGGLGGENSKISLIKRGVSTPREFSKLVQSSTGSFAGIYLAKEDGTPVYLVRFTPGDRQPFSLTKAQGDRVTQSRSRYNRRGHIIRKSFNFNYDSSTLSLTELANKVNFADEKFDMYGVGHDAERMAKREQRSQLKHGIDSDIDSLKSGAASKFLRRAAEPEIGKLKELSNSIVAEITSRINGIGAGDEGGEDPGRIDPDSVTQLNAMLRDAKGIKNLISSNDALRNKSWGGKLKSSYRLDDFREMLAMIQKRLDNFSRAGKYEHLARKLVNELIG